MKLRVTGGEIRQLAIDGVIVVLVKRSCLKIEGVDARKLTTNRNCVALGDAQELAAEAASLD